MRIIVGVDASPGSRAALRYAMQEAAHRSTEVVVVHAWQPAFEHVHSTETTSILRAAAHDEATALVHDMISQARTDVPRPPVRVTARPVEGSPAETLVAQARQHDLLVVGSNRGGLVRRLLLGSVSAAVVRNAPCPVVVVPAQDEAAEKKYRGGASQATRSSRGSRRRRGRLSASHDHGNARRRQPPEGSLPRPPGSGQSAIVKTAK